MKPPSLHELTARVVAWHNRHPLAHRIDATQVHSIGEVRLPFASLSPWGDRPAAETGPAPVPPAHGPTLAEALAQRNARLHEGASTPGTDRTDGLPGLPEADGAAGEAADDVGGEAALVIPLLDGDDDDRRVTSGTASPGPSQPADVEGATDLAAPPAAVSDAVYPAPHGGVPASALARAVERRAAARGAVVQPAGGDSPPAPPPGRWQRLVAALRRQLTGRQAGLPPLRAAFSDAFLWPLRPARVARWAQRHGQPQPLAPADWPQRTIDTDLGRRAQLRHKGLAHDLPLHVLTAAIGVGDRRIRVLVGADGSILGPRAYHRSRVGSVCLMLAVGLVGLGWHLRPLHGVQGAGDAAAMAALAASAASASASPAAPMPMVSASAPDSAASADLLALAAGAAEPAASQADPPEDAASAAQAPATRAAAPAADAAMQPQAAIQPTLSQEERYAARVEAARMRGEPIPAPPVSLLPGPVYAVVSPPSRQRETAAGSLAKMQSAARRLDGQVPEHGELVESRGQWRAAWWPFTSLVDAERARVLLAGQGLKAEVIEF